MLVPPTPQVLPQAGLPTLLASLGAASPLLARPHALACSKQWSPVLSADVSDEIFLPVSWV